MNQDNQVWRTQLEKVLARHIKDNHAMYVVVSFYSAVRTIKRMFVGINDAETRQGGLMILLDNFVSYPSNPFMQVHGGKMMPVMQVAIQGMLDAYGYSAEAETAHGDQTKRMDLTQKTIATAHLAHNVAIYALFCEQGADAFINKSRKLRDDLMEIEAIINGEADARNQE